MKLNYRDRVILLAVIAIVVLLGGFFGLIKPKFNDIKENKTARDAVQQEWDGLDAKIQQIPTLRDDVKNTKSEADKVSSMFFSGEEVADGNLISFMQPYQLDKYMQSIMDESNLKVMSMEAGSIQDTTLDYYYYTPTVPTTAILDLADLNGNYTDEISKKLEESNALSERTAENLFVQQYGISVKATKDDLWNFMETISKMDKAIRIDSITITDTDFGVDPSTGKLSADAEKMKDASGKEAGVSEVTMVLNLYSVYELDEPVLE